MGGASGTSLTALSGPHDTPSSGPIEGHIKAPGAVCCGPRATASDACGGPIALSQHHAPAPATPPGPLAGAYECEARCRAVAIGHCACQWAWHCCLGLPCRARAHIQHASPARTPKALGWCPWPHARAARGRAHASGPWPDRRAKHGHPITPQLRASDAGGIPALGAQRTPAQLRLRHRDRSRARPPWACMPGPAGDG